MNNDYEVRLKRHRNTIDDIDSQILDLLAQRLKEVQEVASLKKKHNMPVYHPAREEDLISNLRTRSARAGMDPDLIEEIYRVIIRNSRIRQISEVKQQGIRPGERILIVGGAGQMGSFFAGMFRNSGYSVSILTENDWDQVEELCREIDLALVAVPIHVTVETIKRIAPHLPSHAVLADITSIKTEPVKAMLEHFSGPVLGLHPLFGPSGSTLDKQVVAVTPGRDAASCQWLVEQLTLWGSIVVSASPEEHDEIMDIVQALRHFATFCFGLFLSEKKIDLERTLEFSSPIYRLELGMVGRLFAQDSSLYSEIVFATPSRRKILKDYVATLNRQIALVETNDKSLFMDRFAEVADWFGSFSDQAMRESDFVINKLIQRF